MDKMLLGSEEYNRKAAIIQGLRAGRTPDEIIKFLKCPESVVYDVARNYSSSEESNEVPERPVKRRRSTKSRAENVSQKNKVASQPIDNNNYGHSNLSLMDEKLYEHQQDSKSFDYTSTFQQRVVMYLVKESYNCLHCRNFYNSRSELLNHINTYLTEFYQSRVVKIESEF